MPQFWKIPLLLLTWASYVISSTPPTRPPHAEDRAKYTRLTRLAMLLQRHDIGRIATNSFIACLLLAEMAFAAGLDSFNYTHDEGISSSPQLYTRWNVSPLFVFGVSSVIVAGLLRWWAYRTMGRHFTFELAVLKDHQLITHGPYAYVRHPGYTAVILNVFGLLACELSAGSWWVETRAFASAIGKGIAILAVGSVGFLATVVSRAPAEDRMMHKEFGRQWEEWSMEVPCMFFPGIL